MEEQLLPHEGLQPAYEKVVWLYVYRDFSGNDADLAAERVCLRFGFTSYPQHHLIHPDTLQRLADTGRSVKSFLAAVGRAKVKPSRTSTTARAIHEAEKRAASLEKSGSVKDARKAIDDEDIVVRFRAAQILGKEDPKALAKRAEDLLAVANDPFRYEICRALARTGDAKAARALDAVVREPQESLNPNVLRIEAVKALAACGDAKSVEAIAPHASSGAYRNGLTRIAVDALLAITERHPKAKAAAKKALARGYPEPAKGDARERRMCESLAKHVHGALKKLTGKRVKFPDSYDAKAVAKLRKAW
jgi:hypothetical protein